MAATRFMCALVIVDAANQDLLPLMGDAAPEVIWDPTAALMKRIDAGERADGIFAIDASMDKLAEAGVIDLASRKPIVQAEFGIAVQDDMSAPSLNDQSDLIKLLLDVPSIVYSRAGASGIYFEKLIDRLGIGAEIRAKSLVVPAGLTGEKVRDGEAVLAVQQMSELLAVEGIQILGPFPPDCQQVTDFSAAVFSKAENAAGAQTFIDMLTSEAAARSFTSRGLKLKF